MMLSKGAMVFDSYCKTSEYFRKKNPIFASSCIYSCSFYIVENNVVVFSECMHGCQEKSCFPENC